MSKNPPTKSDITDPLFSIALFGGSATVIAACITAIAGGPVAIVATAAAAVFGYITSVGFSTLGCETSGSGNLARQVSVGRAATLALTVSTFALTNALVPTTKSTAPAKEEFNYVCKGNAQPLAHGDNTLVAMKKTDCKKVKI